MEKNIDCRFTAKQNTNQDNEQPYKRPKKLHNFDFRKMYGLYNRIPFSLLSLFSF